MRKNRAMSVLIWGFIHMLKANEFAHPSSLEGETGAVGRQHQPKITKVKGAS